MGTKMLYHDILKICSMSEISLPACNFTAANISQKGKGKLVQTLFSACRGTDLLFNEDWARPSLPQETHSILSPHFG